MLLQYALNGWMRWIKRICTKMNNAMICCIPRVHDSKYDFGQRY